MIQPGAMDIEADRWTPFASMLKFVNLDLTGSTLEAHVRVLRDATGTPLIDLDNTASVGAQGLRIVSVSTDTIAAHIAAGRMTEAQIPEGLTTADTISISFIDMRISEVTVEALPAATELGDDATLYWDMQITPSGGIKQVYLAGEFIVRAGVTH